jgi:hypothetical protein
VAPVPTELYTELMKETKARILLIGSLLAAQVRTDEGVLASAFVREMGFLQLRMLCEGVALACLVAHGDIQATQSSKIRRMYKADEIMKELENLHPDFYPRATYLRPAISVDGAPALTIDHSKAGGLSKQELLDFYGRSGDFLHRGSMKKLTSSTHVPYLNAGHRDFQTIATMANKFTALLETHVISSADMRRHFVCWLSDSTNHGDVSVILATR